MTNHQRFPCQSCFGPSWGGGGRIGSFAAPSVALHPRRKHHTLYTDVHHALHDPQDEVVVNSLGSLDGADNCDSGRARCMMCVGHLQQVRLRGPRAAFEEPARPRLNGGVGRRETLHYITLVNCTGPT